MRKQMTLRNVLAIGLFLVGASWLWLTPMWLSQGKANVSLFDPRGLLSVLAILGFAAVAWGVFRSESWWEPVAVATALVGVAAAFVFWFWAAASAGSQAGIAANALLHIAAGALVVAVLLIKPAEQWLAGHL